jgi:NhaA family Na+:H+ antiporter
MLVPASICHALTANRPGMQGWGRVMATDAAFVVGCFAVLGSRIPSSLRLLTLAIFDDVGAILVGAFGYRVTLSWWALAACAFGTRLCSELRASGYDAILSVSCSSAPFGAHLMPQSFI